MDVRNPDEVKKAADLCVEHCGCLPHMVVNNAAGNFISPTERLSPNAFRTIVDIVLNGTANVSLELGKRLIEANQGFIITIINYTTLLDTNKQQTMTGVFILNFFPTELLVCTLAYTV